MLPDTKHSHEAQGTKILFSKPRTIVLIQIAARKAHPANEYLQTSEQIGE